MKDLVEAQEAICRIAVTLERDILHRNIPINIIPVPQFNIMEDFTLWIPDEGISKLWKFWHAHNKKVNAWSPESLSEKSRFGCKPFGH